MNEEHNDSTLIQKKKYKDTGKVHSNLRKEWGLLGKRRFKIFTKTLNDLNHENAFD